MGVAATEAVEATTSGAAATEAVEATTQSPTAAEQDRLGREDSAGSGSGFEQLNSVLSIVFFDFFIYFFVQFWLVNLAHKGQICYVHSLTYSRSYKTFIKNCLRHVVL